MHCHAARDCSPQHFSPQAALMQDLGVQVPGLGSGFFARGRL
jgi:hypothetical protein